MVDMHEFIVQEGAEKLLPPTVNNLISRRRRSVRELCNHCSWREVQDEVREMQQKGYFPKANVPAGHIEQLNAIYGNPSAHEWMIGREKQFGVPLEPNDILLIGGMLASKILQPDEFWNVPAGFSGVSDFQGTIGAMLLRHKERFIHPGGYTWESTDNGKKYQTRITADMNGDFRMERICTSYEETFDPYRRSVHYKPISERDHQIVAPSYGCERTILAAVLKYVDQEEIDVPCLREKGNGVRKFLQGKEQVVGHFGDFGTTGGDRDAFYVLMDFRYRMGDNNDTSWFLRKHAGDNGSYAIHVDRRGRLAFTESCVDILEEVIDKKEYLSFPPEEIEHVILGLFAQTQQGLGRTSAAELLDILNYRFSDEFAAEMDE